MITRISIADKISSSQKFVTFPFYDNGVAVENAPFWGMTLKAAGSMRFRWAEKNLRREKMISEICASASAPLFPVALELVHSKNIFCIENKNDTFEKQGDGIITKNISLLPVVTVADCMPLFLYDRKSCAFGVLHSGWKGTGIVANAIQILCEKFSANVSDIFVALGPHIRKCCYIVDEERAEYFVKNFGSECISKFCAENLSATSSDKFSADKNSRRAKYHLSLEKANSLLLKKIGIEENHVTVATDCTCHCQMFGSFRREACALEDGKSCEDMSRLMTVQAAFCGYVA